MSDDWVNDNTVRGFLSLHADQPVVVVGTRVPRPVEQVVEHGHGAGVEPVLHFERPARAYRAFNQWYVDGPGDRDHSQRDPHRSERLPRPGAGRDPAVADESHRLVAPFLAKE